MGFFSYLCNMNHIEALQQAYPLSEARAIYRLVMEERFGLSQTDLLLGKDKELSAEAQTELGNIIQRLALGEPVQYVLGTARFCGRNFIVAPGVLIPRPETEELVYLLGKRLPSPCRVLDIGTGSGCIAVTLALQGHTVSAMDISKQALAIAESNAAELKAEVEFLHEDILHPSPCNRQWEAIVSNPPYICRNEAKDMEEHVLAHEPHLALFVPDTDPLLFYRHITLYALEHLMQGGLLAFEVNRAYAHDVKSLLQMHGFENAEIITDQFHNERMVLATKAYAPQTALA